MMNNVMKNIKQEVEKRIDPKEQTVLFKCIKNKKYKDDFIKKNNWYFVLIKTQQKHLLILTTMKNIVRIPVNKHDVFKYFKPAGVKCYLWKHYKLHLLNKNLKEKDKQENKGE